MVRVVEAMRENLGEPLTLDDLASVAMFSKYHFSRMFQRQTGVSPGRFLSALRLQQAKRLLVTTDWNVVDISLRVGYRSVGTFSSRFSRSVGLSPTMYRRCGGHTPSPVGCRVVSRMEPGGGLVEGELRLPDDGDDERVVFVGLFPSRIPEGSPISCTVTSAPGRYLLNVPAGTDGHILAFAPGNPDGVEPMLGDEQSRRVASTPVALPPGLGGRAHADLILERPGPLTPPVLVAMPSLNGAAGLQQHQTLRLAVPA